jgi:hypothetical protein
VSHRTIIRFAAVAALVIAGGIIIAVALSTSSSPKRHHTARAALRTVDEWGYNIDQKKPWVCSQRYGTPSEPYRVRVVDLRIPANAIPVSLKDGCTGYLDITAVTSSTDMVKLQKGAHDLVVTGTLACAGRQEGAHQDGIQASGGTHVRLSLVISCPTINDAGVFLNTGSGGNARPTDVVCERCTILPVKNAAANISASTDSGVRDSSLYRGTGNSAPPNCVRITATSSSGQAPATNPVNEGNECLPVPP